MGRRNRRFAYRNFGLGVLLLALGGAAAYKIDLLSEFTAYRLIADKTKSFLLQRLVRERPLPGAEGGRPAGPPAVAYVLGGDQESLNYKFRSVGRYYREGLVGKILVLQRPGITEYSPALGRNLTNDEWTVMELGEDGVPGEDVELVSVPVSFFGTFGEARGVSPLLRSRGINRLVLVSSGHHLERVWQAFSHFNGDNSITFYTCASEEKAGILELLAESVKLSIYRYALLPVDRLFCLRSGRGVPIAAKQFGPNETISPGLAGRSIYRHPSYGESRGAGTIGRFPPGAVARDAIIDKARAGNAGSSTILGAVPTRDASFADPYDRTAAMNA